MAVEQFSHVGICVSDLERSLRFYCDALGFVPTRSHAVGPEFGRLMEVDDLDLQSRFVRRDGISLELLGFDSPGYEGDGRRRRMNELGLTHLSLRVGDVEATAARVEELGGTVHRGTRTSFDGPEGATVDFVYCTDPDGVRIELMDIPAG